MKLLRFLLPLAIADDVHPVFYAIRDQQLDRALEIVKGMDDINIKGPGGQTPLMMSVLGGHYHLVKELLAMKADASIPEKDGFGPMHGAGFQGRAEIAQMLINHGLDKSDRHRDGFTPMLRACWGTEMRHTEAVRTFIKNGVDPMEANPDGKTCMDITQNESTKVLLNDIFNQKKKEDPQKDEL